MVSRASVFLVIVKRNSYAVGVRVSWIGGSASAAGDFFQAVRVRLIGLCYLLRAVSGWIQSLVESS